MQPVSSSSSDDLDIKDVAEDSPLSGPLKNLEAGDGGTSGRKRRKYSFPQHPNFQRLVRHQTNVWAGARCGLTDRAPALGFTPKAALREPKRSFVNEVIMSAGPGRPLRPPAAVPPP